MSLTKLEIINYSERAFAVVGERTKALKEDLMALGGKYNRGLKCGAGWIFPLKALESVTSFLEKKGEKVVKKDLSDSSSSSEEETKDAKASKEVKVSKEVQASKDSKVSKDAKEVKVSQPLKAKVITPNPAKDAKASKDANPAKDAKPSKESKTVAKKVVLSDSESDSEEEQVKLKPVKSSKASKVPIVSKGTNVSKASKESDSDSSDDETEPPHVSYEEHARVTRELESAKQKVKLLQENLSKLQIRFLDCEEAKNIAVQKYKTLKCKVKEGKKKCENVATSTEFEEPGMVESQEEEESRPTVCVSM